MLSVLSNVSWLYFDFNWHFPYLLFLLFIDSSVRAEIGEQITRMTEYFRNKPCTYLSVVSEYMVPILMIYFKDQSIPVSMHFSFVCYYYPMIVEVIMIVYHQKRFMLYLHNGKLTV